MNYKKRTNSRIIAMMVLYNYDINKELDYEKTITLINENNILEKTEESIDALEYDEEYLKTLVDGVISKQDYIDYVISICTEKYTLDAISFVDRSILRLGSYEMIYLHLPKEIVINEMVNISKVYSEIEGFKSPRFDNAILDKIAAGGFKDE